MTTAMPGMQPPITRIWAPAVRAVRRLTDATLTGTLRS